MAPIKGRGIRLTQKRTGQKFCLLLAGLVGSLDSLADLAGLPEVKTYIELALGNPKVVAGVMVAVAVITLKARARTM